MLSFECQVQWALYFTTFYFKTTLDYMTAWLGPKGQFSVLNDLYFKTTCNIRPHFLGPMGGLKIEGPLYSEFTESSRIYFQHSVSQSIYGMNILSKRWLSLVVPSIGSLRNYIFTNQQKLLQYLQQNTSNMSPKIGFRRRPRLCQ